MLRSAPLCHDSLFGSVLRSCIKAQADVQRDTALAFLPTMLTAKDLQRNLYGRSGVPKQQDTDFSGASDSFSGKDPSFNQSKRFKADFQQNFGGQGSGEFSSRGYRRQRGGRGGAWKNPQ